MNLEIFLFLCDVLIVEKVVFEFFDFIEFVFFIEGIVIDFEEFGF